MYRLSQKSIRTQLLVLLGSAALFLACVVGMGTWSLLRTANLADQNHEVNMPRQDAANDLAKAVAARALAARNLALASDPATRDQEFARVKQSHVATLEALNQLKKLVTEAGAEERRLVESVDAIEQEYGPIALKIADIAVSGDLSAAGYMTIEQCRPMLERLNKSVSDLLAHERASLHRDHDLLMSTTQKTVVAVAVFGVVAVLLLVGLGLFIVRGLVNSSQAALVAVEKMAAGDMSLRLQAEGDSEPQRVLRALDGMAHRLREVLGTVRHATDQIAIASDEVAKGSLDLSTRTEMAASSLQETAASMEQMTATVQQASGSAREANQLAGQSAGVARQGGEMVEQVVRTMGDIQRGSSRIGEIIGVIDGIAFQTNILALNAAVEAARAGEQGRGFAVVAGEVRNLAQRSAQAAKEIKVLIEAANDQVAGGTRLVQEAGGTITEVVENARRVSGIVGEIMASSAEQADGVAQINVAVGQLDQMTQQNAALVEQTSAAAESLKDQARHLAAAVAVFRFDSATDAAALPQA
ncbi:MAG: methyl-accepting chemotaxis protein [Hydrogenophaga sp.]|uniref:methyl-accepting chemotaxis protein n=1 Tax=Hydrogenophaga sp. TaxID=1904254 RepID=UPI004036E064